MYKNFKDMVDSGGGFLKTICMAFKRADPSNLRKLSQAFPYIGKAFQLYENGRENDELEFPQEDVFGDADEY